MAVAGEGAAGGLSGGGLLGSSATGAKITPLSAPASMPLALFLWLCNFFVGILFMLIIVIAIAKSGKKTRNTTEIRVCARAPVTAA